MGQGFVYSCKNCGLNELVGFGIGMMFPQTYQEVLQSARNGEYGAKWKALSNKSAYVTINAGLKLYLCPNCGQWKIDYDLTLYEPLDAEKIKAQQYGEKTVKEWGFVPYVSEDDLSSKYTVLERFAHKCPKCDSTMLSVEEEQFYDSDLGIELKCPSCGALNGTDESIFWD